jgi:hypothetical protein
MTKKTNLIAPELVQRMARLPFLWHYFNEKDGHILVTQTPAGIADRVVVFGHGLRALEQLQAAVTLIEGTLAYLGYEDPPSARIDIVGCQSVGCEPNSTMPVPMWRRSVSM